MIFATVGTHSQPFDRFVRSLERLPVADQVIIQYGVGRPPRGMREAVAVMSFEQVEQRMAEADVVVSHAGVGSILCARAAGHTPVVMPRVKRLGEHVDNHQMELTTALAERGAVVPVWPDGELAAAIEAAPGRAEPTGIESYAGPLVAEVVRALRSG